MQRESDAAAKEVFGNDYCGLLEQVHVDDDALVEGRNFTVHVHMCSNNL